MGDPSTDSSQIDPLDRPSTEEVRSEGAREFMGPGFIAELRKIPSKKKAYQFWYHPLTELGIFALVVLSIVLLIVEVSLPSDDPVGWMGGLATGEVSGWFFWADAVITLIFIVEYASKLWITPKGRKWFFVSHSWIELLALLPILRVFRLFRIFRALRVFRLLRVLRSVRLTRSGPKLTGIFRSFGRDVQQERARNLVVTAYFLSAMVFGTVGILVFEKGADSGFDTIFDGLWWCVVTLSTVGYGDVVPVTPGGRLIAGIVMIMGLGFWSLVAGVFAASFIHRARSKETIGLDILGIRGHILIFGWHENGKLLARDLRARYPSRHIVVVTPDEHLGITLDTRFHHVREDPANTEKFEISHLPTAGSVVILAAGGDELRDADIDARTLLICLAVRKARLDLRVVVELVDEDNYDHARFAGATDVVVTRNYTGALMSQLVQSPGLNKAFFDLFDPGRGARFNEAEVNSDLVGRPFSEAASLIHKTTGAAVVGYRRDDQLFVAPSEDLTVEEGDRAVLIERIDDE